MLVISAVAESVTACGPPVPEIIVYVMLVMAAAVMLSVSPAEVIIVGSSGSVSRGRSHARCRA